jgi:predicted metal-dependent phosphotriesterase family hydrolase
MGLAGSAHRPLDSGFEAARVKTVQGPIAPEAMGPTLPHENVLVDFFGAAQVSRGRYDADEVFRISLPHLRRNREQGINTLVECTSARMSVALIRAIKARGLLGRVLLSHDAGWYHVGEPGGGTFRPYDTLMADFEPALKAAGLTGAKADHLTKENLRAAFAIRVRPAL